MKGYKVFNPDWKCRDFQYEVGKTYSMDEEPQLCERGFHFCKTLANCFSYYDFKPNNKVAEVEAIGTVLTEENEKKYVTNKITILKELNWNEVLEMVNTGNRNTGFKNSGNWNSGNWNSGNCNSGDWNKTNHSSGCFNTKEEYITMFNKPTEWTYQDWLNSDARYILQNVPMPYLDWCYESKMTNKEKEKNPSYKTMGGFLKKYQPKRTPQEWYSDLSKQEQEAIKLLPNFDKNIFKEITGIDVGEINETE